MSFQSQVNYQQAPGVVGARASMNPVATVDAGPGSLVAGAYGAVVGRFAWNVYATPGGPGVANNFSPTAPVVPDGFISNEQQAFITVWLDQSSLVVPAGYGVTEYERGDFWAQSQLSDAAIGQKVFANLFDGQIIAADTGAFPTNTSGSAASIVGTVADLTNYSLNITSVVSGVVAVGQAVLGEGYAPGTYIESFGTFNGATGTVFTTQNPSALFTAGSLLTSTPEAVGGGTATCSGTTSQTHLTIETLLTGQIYKGQLVKGTNVATGTYVASLGTYNGATGDIILSANLTGAITSDPVEFSSWIETPWYVKSPGNVGDIIKIGVKN